MARCPACKAINHNLSQRCIRCGSELRTVDRDPPVNAPVDRAPPTDPELVPDPDLMDPGPVDDLQGAPEHERESSIQAAPQGSALEHFSAGPPPWLVASDVPEMEADPDPLAFQDPVPAADAETLPWRFRSTPDLRGRVFLAQDRPPENPDFDPFAWLCRLLALLLVFLLPVVVLAHAYHRFGVVLVYGILGVLFLLSRLRLSSGLLLLSAVGLGRTLGAAFRGDQRQVPVRECRVMDENQREHIVRIKGAIVRGGVQEHDEVALWGRRRRGTFLFRRGYNLRAGAEIVLEGRYSWFLCLLLAVLLAWVLLDLHRLYPDWPLWNGFRPSN